MAKKTIKAESHEVESMPEQSSFIYLDQNACALRSGIFKDGILQCKGCDYILSSDHITACKYCLMHLNNKNKMLRNAVNEAKAEMVSLQGQMEFLCSWDQSFFNGSAATGDIVLRTRDGQCFRTYRFVLV